MSFVFFGIPIHICADELAVATMLLDRLQDSYWLVAAYIRRHA